MRLTNAVSVASDVLEGNYSIPSYQREYCWDNHKLELFIDSVENGIPLGLLHLHKQSYDSFDIIDGLHRIRNICRLLLGKGIYFNLETKKFTLDNSQFDYSEYVKEHFFLKRNIPLSDNMLDVFISSYEKVRNFNMHLMIYSGDDSAVETAFKRMNMDGVALTPIFNKVLKKEKLVI